MSVCTIITGAGGSIGSAITRAIANEGRNVIMACRNITKDTPLCQQLNDECRGTVTIMELNLASLDSVVTFAHRIQQEGISVEALINNAGIMCKEYSTTDNGYEMTIGVNFIGTYLLTHLLLPMMQERGNITFTTSLTRYIGKVDNKFFDLSASNYGRFKAYSRSKLATTILTAHLARQLAPCNIHVNAADPGIVNTGMIHMDAWFDPIADRFFRPFISSPEKGAISALSASASQVSGMIFNKNKYSSIPSQITNHKYQKWLINETHRRIAPWLK